MRAQNHSVTVAALLAALLLPAAASQASPVAFIDVNGTQGVPSAPDGNGNYWNALTAAGSSVTLVDTANASTGWSAVLSQVGSGGGSGMTGGLNNTIAAPSPYNVQEAYADGWYDNTSGNPSAQVSFSGLNSASLYRLTLWGARGSGWNDGTVTVTAGTPPTFSTFQENSLLEMDVTPNGSGNIAFQFDNGTGGSGSNSVLSLLSIEEDPVVPPSPPPFKQGRMLVDFGKLGQETATDAGGRTWSNVARSPGAITSPQLLLQDGVTADGTTTDTDLFAVNPSTGYGIGGSDSTSDATGLGYPLSASRDQMYISNGFGPVTIELRGLATDGTTYNLIMFGTLTNDARTSEWTVGGMTQTLDVNNNTANVVTFLDIAPDASGIIPILYDSAGATSGVWSVLEITANAVPEPSTLALAGLALFAVPCLRRRRRTKG